MVHNHMVKDLLGLTVQGVSSIDDYSVRCIDDYSFDEKHVHTMNRLS